jgi:phosphatidylinositol alpha-1,6-mannosyltransferase
MPDVLVLTPDFPPEHGGIQVLMHRVVSSWTRVRPRVVTLAQPSDAEFDPTLSFAVRRVGFGVAGHRLRLIALNALAVLEGIRRRPDVVLSGHIVTSPAAWLLSKLLRVPFVQYLYGQEVAVRPRLTRFAVRRAACSITISSHTDQLALARGATPASLRRIPPGVDLATPPAGSTRTADVVVVARLDERYKGHDVLIRALPLVRSRVPEARLVVIGDGVLRPAYEALVRSVGVSDGIVFAGSVDDAERDALLDRAAVFAMPSRQLPGGAGEGFGIVFLEAGTHRLPVIGGAVAGTLDAVVDGETGVLVDPRDHVALADAIVDLLADADRARGMGEAGVRRAEAFSWPTVSRRVEELVLEVAP